MITCVNLHLPETLHHSNLHTLGQTSGEERTSAQLHRKEQRASQDTSVSASKSSVDQKSISSDATSNVINPTATVFDYAEFVFASNKRSAEAELFASLIWRTRQDLTEASRLYLSPTVTNFLAAWPDRKAWIDKILSDIRTALVDIGSHIESVRSSRDDDEMSKMKRKFEYILSHQKRLASKQQTLANSHQILLGAIQVMQTVEQCVGLGGSVPDPIFEAPVRPWLRSDSDIVRGPYSRRSSSKNLSSLSVIASESRDTFEVNLPEASPAELPGSTPDDLIRSGTQEIFKASRPRKSHSYNDTRVYPPATVDAPFHPLNNPSQGEQEHTKPDTSQVSSDKLSDRNGTQEDVVHDQADRRSAHAPSSLNAVVDRIIERTQSIASTTASIKMPVLAKRYRPRPVHVQRPHLRHHSLPSELPLYQGQSSLVDDLREWIVQTAASDQFTGTTLTRSPTVSSTTGSIASRQEMMKMLVSFPNVREDCKNPSMADKAVRDPSAAQDNTTTAANCPLPPSEPNSPPTISETAHSQDNTTLASGFPLPPSQPNSPATVSETAQSEEDLTLVSSFPLPPSLPSNPPLVSSSLRQTERTVSPSRVFAITRKPLPPAVKDNISVGSSPTTSPNRHHSELFIDGNVTVVPPSHIHGTDSDVHAMESPKQPQRPPPPPPPTLPPTEVNDSLAASQAQSHNSPKPSAILDTATENPKAETLQHQELTHRLLPQSLVPSSATPAPPHPSSPPPLPPNEPNQQASVQLPPPNTPSEPQNTPPVPTVPAVIRETSVEQPKARTAEAKRRAMHARRMKIAFG
ncbi:hypothetical protein BU25DRAFT_449153 [Macroventuria anomochaeta]|uniref:Uncharacterized protein n=1 Tax=Macroventuria anomochaeta TaxID=301207 RepID=A0ACB6RXG1_9PLEO|nr:uncharacterized protein BU25DRAFT_449153 [Macroventuria anomochaeta]KAF2626566.1 hypothetical protein BU25DRAFT_449153 [Macroventuria anomochaeta]